MSSSVTDYQQELLTQRAERAQQLLGDRSWLTLAGLFWLKPGANTIGAAPHHPVVLSGPNIPTHVGVLTVEQESIKLCVASGVAMTHQGEPIQDLVMQHDMTGHPDYVSIDTLTFLIIKRGERYAVRLYDTTNPARHRFPGLSWYPIDPALRIIADYVPHTPPRTLKIATATGDITPSVNPGAVHFTLDGHPCSLEAEDRGSKLFFNFCDLTNRDTTYGAGRFLYTDVPVDGKVTLDFNQATNPYCAYTLYATCPLPPAQNRLPVRIAAGEKRYEGQIG